MSISLNAKERDFSLSWLQQFRRGQKDVIPIAIGYLAVSFALGIALSDAGVGPFAGFAVSFFNMASAGEYAGARMIIAHSRLLETALMVLAANGRYLLMSTAFTQRIERKTSMFQRWLMAFGVTDEMFAMALSNRGMIRAPYYFGMMSLGLPAWATGTMCGIFFGALLPGSVVSALSVALFAMFLAVIIPPSKENKPIRVVVLCGMALSFLFSVAPYLNRISEGARMLGITIVLAIVAARLAPVKGEGEE